MKCEKSMKNTDIYRNSKTHKVNKYIIFLKGLIGELQISLAINFHFLYLIKDILSESFSPFLSFCILAERNCKKSIVNILIRWQKLFL